MFVSKINFKFKSVTVFHNNARILNRFVIINIEYCDESR